MAILDDPSKFFENFFLLQITQNGLIRENKWFLAIFNFFSFTVVTRLPDLVIFGRFLKMKCLSIFSTLADWICLILPIMKVLITLNHLTYISYLAGWHKYAKCGPLCVKRFKILICDFGYTGDFPMNIVIC